MAVSRLQTIQIPEGFWFRHEVTEALSSRDFATLFELLRDRTHASQTQIGMATGIAQTRISEVMRHVRKLETMAVVQRIAEGLGMPDSARMALGLAPSPSSRLRVSTLTEVDTVFPTQADAAGEIQTLAETSDQIDILAVRGLGILSLNKSLLREAFKPETCLRVFLIDPDSEACAQRGEEIGESAESFSAGVSHSIARIKELDAGGGNVELYLYSTTPIWRILRLDQTLFVSAFTTHHEGHTSPMHKLVPTRTGVLHAAFLRTLEAYARTSTRII